MLCVYNTAVELLNSDALLTVDIVEMSNIRFLNQQQLLLDDEQDWSFHPYFAAGRMYALLLSFHHMRSLLPLRSLFLAWGVLLTFYFSFSLWVSYDHSFAVRYLVQLYFQPDLAEPIEYLTGANPFVCCFTDCVTAPCFRVNRGVWNLLKVTVLLIN